MVSRLLFKLLPFCGPYDLSLDRTNWKFGSRNINILVLGVVYQGLCFPILWVFLGDKQGNSDQTERITLIQRFIRLFGEQAIGSLSADREFVGKDWWQFLIDHKIRFFIRMRANMKVHIPHKGIVDAAWLFNSLPLNTFYQYPKIVQVKGCWVYLSGAKFVNQEGKLELLIIASYKEEPQALDFYKNRWQIETMFKAFKTSGFNLEDTHLKDDERLNKLLMMLTIAFYWAYKVGIYKHQHIKPIKIKKHGRSEKSLFAYGLEFLAQALINNFKSMTNKLIQVFLSCT